MWIDRIYKYAKVESNNRVKVKSLVAEYETSVQLEESGECDYLYVLCIQSATPVKTILFTEKESMIGVELLSEFLLKK